jgi:hypothetical protein
VNRRERRAQWQAARRAVSNSPAIPAVTLAPVAGIAPRAHGAPAFSAVNLQIGELVLRGFEKRHSSRIAAAFERSLMERLRSGTLPDAMRHRASSSSLRLVPFILRSPNDPVGIGEQLAASVFEFERNGRHRGGLR